MWSTRSGATSTSPAERATRPNCRSGASCSAVAIGLVGGSRIGHHACMGGRVAFGIGMVVALMIGVVGATTASGFSGSEGTTTTTILPLGASFAIAPVSGPAGTVITARAVTPNSKCSGLGGTFIEITLSSTTDPTVLSHASGPGFPLRLSVPAGTPTGKYVVSARCANDATTVYRYFDVSFTVASVALPVVSVASTHWPFVVVGCGNVEIPPGTVTLSRTGRLADPLRVTYTISRTVRGTNTPVGATDIESTTFASGSPTVDVTLAPPPLQGPFAVLYHFALSPRATYTLGTPSTTNISPSIAVATCATFPTTTTTEVIATGQLPRTGGRSSSLALVGMSVLILGTTLWGVSSRRTRRHQRQVR